MPVVDREMERKIVEEGRKQGKSDEFIKTAVLRYRERNGGTPTTPVSATTQKTSLPPAKQVEVPEKQGTLAYLPEAAKETVVQFGKNVVDSGKDFFGGVLDAVKHPIQTTKNLGKVALGAAEKVVPGKQKSEESFDALVDFYKERYGGLSNLKDTIYKDPVGFASDLSVFLTGGGAAASKAGKVSKVAAIEEAGQTASKLGKVLDPVSITAKATSKVTKPVVKAAGRIAGETLGLTTGAGYGAIREAFRNPSPEFTAALRGTKTGESILDDAKEALHGIKDQRSTNYKSQLADLTKNKSQLDITPLTSELEKQFKNFNIKVADDGTLDFSRSTIADKTEAARVRELAEEVKNWGSQPGDLTPEGMDILKRRLDDFYSPSSQARSLVTTMRNKAKQILVKEVPSYERMTADYEKYSQIIKEIEDGLTLKGKASPDTSIRKLTSILRQNNEFRKQLVSRLEQYSGTDLKGQISGVALSEMAPRGLSRVVSQGGLIGGFFNPAIWAALPAASPRVVGEFLRALGLADKQVRSILQNATQKGWLKATPNVLYQADRASDESNP